MRFTHKKKVAVIFLIISSFFGNLPPTQAQDIPESAYISGVAGHPQQYVLSCEARSAVDWMAFWGIQVSEDDFMILLPRSDNPNKGFVGNPNDVWGNLPPLSYGVHAEPVAALLRSYGMQAEARLGLTWDELRLEIAAGRPVITWVIGDMWVFSAHEYVDSEGEKALAAPFEHTMVVIGYDTSIVYLVDAFSGWTVSYWRQAFLDSWAVLGNMAITGYLPQPEPTFTATPEAKPKITVAVESSSSQFLPGKQVFLPFIIELKATQEPTLTPTPLPTPVMVRRFTRPRLRRR
jgi:uncharacterized protein YvpB